MVEFEIEYVVDIPREDMWRLRDDREFVRWQYEHSSDMSYMEITERYACAEDEDLQFMHCRISPSVPLPRVVLSYIGDENNLYVEDVQSHRLSEPYSVTFRSSPNFFKDYAVTFGTCEFLEHEDDSRRTRVVLTGEVQVSVSYVGGLVESFILNNLRSFYEAFPDLVHGYMEAKRSGHLPSGTAEAEGGKEAAGAGEVAGRGVVEAAAAAAAVTAVAAAQTARQPREQCVSEGGAA